MFMSSDDSGRGSSLCAEVVFDGEIVGILFSQAYTRAQTVVGITYHNTSTYTYDMSGNNTTTTQTDSDEGRIIEPGNFFADTLIN